MSVLLKIRDEVNTSRVANKEWKWRRGGQVEERKTAADKQLSRLLFPQSHLLFLCWFWVSVHGAETHPAAAPHALFNMQSVWKRARRPASEPATPHSRHSCLPGFPCSCFHAPALRRNIHTQRMKSCPPTHTHTPTHRQVHTKAALLCISL